MAEVLYCNLIAYPIGMSFPPELLSSIEFYRLEISVHFTLFLDLFGPHDTLWSIENFQCFVCL